MKSTKTDDQIFKDYCDLNGWSINIDYKEKIEKTYEYQLYYIKVQWADFKKRFLDMFKIGK